EEVFRIVLGLDPLQALVVGSIRGGNGIARLVLTQVIYIPASGEEWLHPLVCFARPGDAGARVCRLHPLREHEEVVTLPAMRKRGVALADSGCHTVDMLEEQEGHRRWTARETVDHGPNRGVAQFREEARPP